MKLKRKGGLTAGIITLSAVALTSVGFAAWVISAGDSTDITGNIEVDTVEENKVHEIIGVYDEQAGLSDTTDGSVSKLNGSSTQSIKFGANKGTAASSSELSTKWLSTNNTDKYEHLTAKFYVCVKNDDVDVGSLTAANYVKTGFAVKNSSSPTAAGTDALANYKGYEGARQLGLIGDEYTVTITDLGGAEKNTAPSSTSYEIANLVETKIANGQLDKTVRRTWYCVTITFKWGNMWGGNQNPYDYYNAMYSSNYLVDYLPFSEYRTYTAGEYVMNGTKIYKCKANITTAEAWTAAHWDEITVTDYSSSNTYTAGDFVKYEGHTYKCKADITTAEAWTAAHWDDVSIKASDHAKKYLTALDNVLTGVTYTFTFKTYFSSDDRTKDTTFKSSDDKMFVVA